MTNLRHLFAPALLALLSMSGAAQTAPAPTGDPRALPVLAAARAAITGLPDPIVALETMHLATAEDRLFPADASKDFVAAFKAAQALPVPASANEPLATIRKQVTGTSLLFLGRKDGDQALALVRQTTPMPGTQKADLYDALLLLPSKIRTPEQTLALIHECVQVDGSFPFGTATLLLGNKSLAADERTALAREGYAAADKDLTSIQAMAFVGAAHRAVPALDPTAAGLLAAMVTALAQDATPENQTINALQANGMLRLLGQIDAARAQALKTQYPAFVAPPAPDMGGYKIRANAAGNDITISGPPAFEAITHADATAKRDPEKAVADAAAVRGDGNRFEALVGVGGILASSGHADQAKEAADAALTLLDGGKVTLRFDIPPLTSEQLRQAATGGVLPLLSALASAPPETLTNAADLAVLLTKIDEGNASARVMDRCWSAFEAPLAAREQDYNALPPADRVVYAQYLLDQGAFVQPIFTSLAKADFAAAAAHARGLASSVLRPMALMGVAASLNPPLAQTRPNDVAQPASDPALASLPPAVAPLYQIYLHPNDVSAAAAAFHDAAALAPGDPNDPAGRLRNEVKRRVEREALLTMGMKDLTQGLDLVRQVKVSPDLSKADLYTSLLAARMDLPASVTVLGLVKECVAADGSFPYQVASRAFAPVPGFNAPATDRAELTQLGVAHAKTETDPEGAAAAVSFIAVIHSRTMMERRPPAPDDNRDDAEALAALIPVLAKAKPVGTLQVFEIAGAGSNAVRLLLQVDPARGATMRDAYPAFAKPPALPGGEPSASIKVLMEAGKYGHTDPAKAAADAEALPDTKQRFQALTNVAFTLQERGADTQADAKDAADHALAMLQSGQVDLSVRLDPLGPDFEAGYFNPSGGKEETGLADATQLVAILQKLGEADAAASLAKQCVAAALRPLPALAATYNASRGNDRAIFALYLLANDAPVVGALSAEAQVSTADALASARTVMPEPLRALALAAVEKK